MKVIRPLAAMGATLSLVLLGTGTVNAGSTAGRTCSGTLAEPGSIAPGTYSSLTVVGFCLGPPTGNVVIKGDVAVAKGAALAANYPALAPGAPEGDANWVVKGNVSVGQGATLLLGCEPAVNCVNTTHDAVKGNVTSTGALGVILHSDNIGGSVTYTGGGGGVNCNPGFGPFSFGVYSDAEDDVITGNLTVTISGRAGSASSATSSWAVTQCSGTGSLIRMPPKSPTMRCSGTSRVSTTPPMRNSAIRSSHPTLSLGPSEANASPSAFTRFLTRRRMSEEAHLGPSPNPSRLRRVAPRHQLTAR